MTRVRHGPFFIFQIKAKESDIALEAYLDFFFCADAKNWSMHLLIWECVATGVVHAGFFFQIGTELVFPQQGKTIKLSYRWCPHT